MEKSEIIKSEEQNIENTIFWYLNTPFGVKIKHNEGTERTWGTNLVEIYQKENDVEKKIGEYKRNYPSFSMQTFLPFQLNGKWYAAYSKNYTCTSIMSLPDCAHLCGEPPHSFGFCPTEYYVPSYYELEVKTQLGRKRKEFIEKDEDFEKLKNDYKMGNFFNISENLKYVPYLFLRGCIWGDDYSFKIECIDLTNLENGIIKRFAPFDYCESISSLSLIDSIELTSYNEKTKKMSLHVSHFTRYYNIEYTEEKDSSVEELEKDIKNDS